MPSEMDKLVIPLGDYPVKDELYTGIYADSRERIVEVLRAVKEKRGDKGYLEITMPCGYSQVFREYEDIPYEDLPCPCGQEGRYLIRYKKE